MCILLGPDDNTIPNYLGGGDARRSGSELTRARDQVAPCCDADPVWIQVMQFKSDKNVCICVCFTFCIHCCCLFTIVDKDAVLSLGL